MPKPNTGIIVPKQARHELKVRSGRATEAMPSRTIFKQSPSTLTNANDLVQGLLKFAGHLAPELSKRVDAKVAADAATQYAQISQGLAPTEEATREGLARASLLKLKQDQAADFSVLTNDPNFGRMSNEEVQGWLQEEYTNRYESLKTERPGLFDGKQGEVMREIYDAQYADNVASMTRERVIAQTKAEMQDRKVILQNEVAGSLMDGKKLASFLQDPEARLGLSFADAVTAIDTAASNTDNIADLKSVMGVKFSMVNPATGKPEEVSVASINPKLQGRLDQLEAQEEKQFNADRVSFDARIKNDLAQDYLQLLREGKTEAEIIKTLAPEFELASKERSSIFGSGYSDSDLTSMLSGSSSMLKSIQKQAAADYESNRLSVLFRSGSQVRAVNGTAISRDAYLAFSQSELQYAQEQAQKAGYDPTQVRDVLSQTSDDLTLQTGIAEPTKAGRLNTLILAPNVLNGLKDEDAGKYLPAIIEAANTDPTVLDKYVQSEDDKLYLAQISAVYNQSPNLGVVDIMRTARTRLLNTKYDPVTKEDRVKDIADSESTGWFSGTDNLPSSSRFYYNSEMSKLTKLHPDKTASSVREMYFTTLEDGTVVRATDKDFLPAMAKFKYRDGSPLVPENQTTQDFFEGVKEEALELLVDQTGASTSMLDYFSDSYITKKDIQIIRNPATQRTEFSYKGVTYGNFSDNDLAAMFYQSRRKAQEEAVSKKQSQDQAIGQGAAMSTAMDKVMSGAIQ